MPIRVLEKWQPIINCMKFDKKYHQMIADYCEQHAKLDNNHCQNTIVTSAPLTMPGLNFKQNISNDNLLPMSVKILEKILQISHIKVEISNIPLDTCSFYSFRIDDDDFFSSLSYYENTVMEEFINILLKKHVCKLKIYKLLSHIHIDSTKRVTYFSNIRWFDRKDKLIRILK